LRQPALSVRIGLDFHSGVTRSFLDCVNSDYVHVHRTRIDDAWIAGQQRAAERLEGLLS
jgi:hypothetical protein